MTRDGIVQVYEALFAALPEKPFPESDARLYTLRMTSGTTNAGPLLVFDKHTLRTSERYANYESVCIAYGSRGVRMASILFAWNAENGPRVVGSVGALNDFSPSLSTYIQDISPQRIVGTPTMIARLGTHMSSELRKRVQALFLTGEHITTSVRLFLSNQFPDANIESAYMLTELGVVGIRCKNGFDNHYHPAQGVTLRIDAPKGTYGEVLVSRLIVRGVDIHDYQTGDIARTLDTSCTCGFDETVELAGRAGSDYVKISSGVVRTENFEQVIKPFLTEIDDYRARVSMVLSDGVYVGKMTVTVYKKNGSLSLAQKERMIRGLESTLQVSPSDVYADFVSKGIFAPLELSIVSEPFPMSIKFRRITYEDQ